MNLGPAVILIIVAAIAGYVLGIIDSRMTAALRKKAEDNKPAPVEAGLVEQNLPGEHTVLKVTIDHALKWHLELDEARIDVPASISPEQRQRLVNVIVQIRPWVDGKSTPVQEAAPVPEPQPAPQLVPEPAPLKPRPTAVAAQPPVGNAPAPKIDAIRGFRSLLNGELKSANEIKSTSIVAMIDEVLQAKLLSSPLLSKGIRLEEGSFGEVVVFVGTNHYPGVDAVPDPEIQAIIKSAIADWEKK